MRKVFPSKELNRLIATAETKNPDLKAAAARLEQSGFSLASARSGLFPSLSAGTSARRSRSNSAGQGFEAGSFTTERFDATLDAAWEADIWGRIKSGIAAAQSDQRALAADFATARQSIAAQTAQAYFQLVANTQLVALAERREKSFQQTYLRVDQRFGRGTATLGEVNLAKSDAQNAKAQIHLARESRDASKRNLAALVGSYPGTQYSASQFPSLKRSIPAGLPSSLLRNRPDINAAYHRLRAADARIKVAHAELFPTISLTAATGRLSDQIPNLTSPDFTIWSLAGNLSAPIFDGGNLRAQKALAEAHAKEELAHYQSAVLTALKEVEDALASESFLASRESTIGEALKSAKVAQERFSRSYESGVGDLLTVLEVQRRVFDTEEALLNVKLLRYQNRVALALALGKAY